MIFHFSFSSFLVDCSHCHLLHQEMLQFFLPQHILPVLKTAVLSSGPFSLIQSIDGGQKENLLVNNTVIFFIPGDHQITLSHINGDITSLIFPQRTISSPSLHLGILYYIARVLRSWCKTFTLLMTTNILNYFKEIHQYKSTKGQFFKHINFEYSTDTLHFSFQECI